MAKPIKMLELHYPMIQFLIINFIPLALMASESIAHEAISHGLMGY